jgi:hypothetical protein
VKGTYNLLSDALSRKYDSTSTQLYDGDGGIVSSKTAAEHVNVGFMSDNVLKVGYVQMDKSVIEECRETMGRMRLRGGVC